MSAIAFSRPSFGSKPLIMQFNSTLQAMTDISPSDVSNAIPQRKMNNRMHQPMQPYTYPQMTKASELPKMPKSHSWSYALSN